MLEDFLKVVLIDVRRLITIQVFEKHLALLFILVYKLLYLHLYSQALPNGVIAVCWQPCMLESE